MAIPEREPCPICGRQPRKTSTNDTGWSYQYWCLGDWPGGDDVHPTLSGTWEYSLRFAAITWNTAVAAYRAPEPEPEPEPEPVAPARYWAAAFNDGRVLHIATVSADTGEEAKQFAIDHVGANLTAADAVGCFELTPSMLAVALDRSRAWYRRELEASGDEA